jgi:Ni,Fe-hydrogenase I large subunit
MPKKIEVYPLNRVEGDLKIKLAIEEGIVVDAWSAGTMYRGFENILKGRGPLDGLVITPRICGICSTAHLNAAAKALDMIAEVNVPDDATRIRNVTLGVEILQSDVRQAFLLFEADFARECYRNHPLYEEAVARCEPLRGSAVIDTVRHTKQILEVIAILGGQWPHSSFMVPGGIASLPNKSEVMQCQYLLGSFRKWYETSVLGCTIDRWMDVESKADLAAWLEEAPAHANSEVGFFLRFAKEAGLAATGRGCGNFISYGLFDMPEDTAVAAYGGGNTFLPPGFVSGGDGVENFRQQKISEEIAHSWFGGYEGGRHPAEGLTQPYATGSESEKYSWSKAPRYSGRPAETGPLAEMVVAGRSLFLDLVNSDGENVLVRQLARLTRPAVLIPALEQWLGEICAEKKHFFERYKMIENGEGYGLIEAPRGGLGHWVRIRNSKIEQYQVITPSAWNGSPRDTNGVRGPWEEALVGTAVADIKNPIEADHVLRSFDPCLVCTVHAVRLDER